MLIVLALSLSFIHGAVFIPEFRGIYVALKWLALKLGMVEKPEKKRPFGNFFLIEMTALVIAVWSLLIPYSIFYNHIYLHELISRWWWVVGFVVGYLSYRLKIEILAPRKPAFTEILEESPAAPVDDSASTKHLH